VTCNGTVYSYAQLEGLWINAGGASGLAPLMAAIAEAESGGCTGALNLTDNGGTQTSVGLWQVSNGTHSYPAAWATAAGNATEAVAKYNSQGLTAWGTYTSGAYKAFLNGSTTPDTNVPAGGTTATLTSATASAACLLSNPFSASLPLIGNISAGPSCIFTKPNARALAAGVLMIPALLLGLAGFVLLGTGLAERTRAVQLITQAVAPVRRIPGVP
jgi:hypothetical protein